MACRRLLASTPDADLSLLVDGFGALGLRHPSDDESGSIHQPLTRDDAVALHAGLNEYLNEVDP